MNSDKLEEEARAGVFVVRQPTYRLLALDHRARRYDGGLGFSLVPWQPSWISGLASTLPASSGVMAAAIEWSFGRKRELGRVFGFSSVNVVDDLTIG